MGMFGQGEEMFWSWAGLGFADPRWIPQHPGGTRYPGLPLPWERRSQIQPDELQNLLWV